MPIGLNYPLEISMIVQACEVSFGVTTTIYDKEIIVLTISGTGMSSTYHFFPVLIHTSFDKEVEKYYRKLYDDNIIFVAHGEYSLETNKKEIEIFNAKITLLPLESISILEHNFILNERNNKP